MPKIHNRLASNNNLKVVELSCFCLDPSAGPTDNLKNASKFILKGDNLISLIIAPDSPDSYRDRDRDRNKNKI